MIKIVDKETVRNSKNVSCITKIINDTNIGI